MDSKEKLLQLMIQYEAEKSDLMYKRQELRHAKDLLYGQIVEALKKGIDLNPNNERLQQYLETAKIDNLNFLYRSLNYMAGNNQKGSLSYYALLLLDDNIKNICLNYNITTESELFKIFWNQHSHPIFKNLEFNIAMLRAKKLAYLDEIFKNVNNILNYQGAYTAFCYVKDYLKQVLIDGNPQSDNELVFKDYDQKLEIVLANLPHIASYLLGVREQIPYSRIAICNQGLSRMARKLVVTNITYEQKVFANGIAFGTTLEKLKDENYEDAKKLIFIPHQKILK